MHSMCRFFAETPLDHFDLTKDPDWIVSLEQVLEANKFEFILSGGVEATTLVANVNAGGLKGNITFEQAKAGESVTVKIALEGPSKSKFDSGTWQFHTNRVSYDVAKRCNATMLGARSVFWSNYKMLITA